MEVDRFAFAKTLNFMLDPCLSGKGGDNFKLLMTAPSGFTGLSGWRTLLKPEMEVPGDLLEDQWKMEIGEYVRRLYGTPRR